MVDLPGYGYAKVPKNVVAAWTETIRLFLVGRVPLRRVFVLIDARHGLKDNDLETLDLLDRSAVSYQVVLTKADKLAASARDTVHGATAARLRKRPAAHPHVHLTSSAKGWGIAALRADIGALAEGGSGAKGIASPDNDGLSRTVEHSRTPPHGKRRFEPPRQMACQSRYSYRRLTFHAPLQRPIGGH